MILSIAWLLCLFGTSGDRARLALQAITRLFLRAGFFIGGVRLRVTGKREVLPG